jgi:hypothetical protein
VRKAPPKKIHAPSSPTMAKINSTLIILFPKNVKISIKISKKRNHVKEKVKISKKKNHMKENFKISMKKIR